MTTAIRVLHVDDELDIAELAAEFIQRHDERFDVETASSASEGLDRLTHREYDCVVSDFDMPGQNGIEFLEAVRESYPHLPFILYTGKGSEEVASDAIAMGVTDYLQKQGGTDQYALLSNRIQNAVEQTRSKQQAVVHQRINNVVKGINQGLARATKHPEIDKRVCEILTDAEPYQFAWIGEHDPVSKTVIPRCSAGIEDDYLQEIEISTDVGAAGRGPTGQAVKNREMAVLQSIPDDPQYEPWREAALKRGYRSSAALPLIYDETLYGVLNVYADRTHAFDERERELLSNLGQTIAHAYHRVELQRQFTDQYRSLFEEAPVMLAFTETVEGEPIIKDCNQMFADRLGYTRTDVLETPLAAYYSEQSTEALLNEGGYKSALTGDFVREQRTLITSDGEEVLTILRASPRRDKDGEVIGTHALYLDITDEQQLTELRRQNERLEEFAGVVSHDLRNPLNVAEGRVDLAAEEKESEHLDIASDALSRMKSLIDDLLSLARIGKTVGDVERVELSGLVDDCWRNVETDSARLVAETERTIQADKTRLQQLLENLLRNAVEHGGDDVEITVGDLSSGFYVEDDGPGISETDREDVLNPGYSTSEDGTGFGLSIVRDVAAAHGWDLAITTGEEDGARFEVANVEFVG